MTSTHIEASTIIHPSYAIPPYPSPVTDRPWGKGHPILEGTLLSDKNPEKNCISGKYPPVLFSSCCLKKNSGKKFSCHIY